MATLTNPSKNTSSLTGVVRHGKDPILNDIKNLTFNDVMLPDGTLVKDTTFLQVGDQVWTNQTKNNATLNAQAKN